MVEFAGRGLALTEDAITTAAARLRVGPAEIWAVFDVETRGCGFLPDKRPVILYEHIFSGQTGGRFDATHGDISNPAAGNYGAAGAHQFDRLGQAIALDRTAALRSASWGLGQVMGFNHQPAGHPDVATLVAAMAGSENAQLLAMLAFVASQGLDRPLRSHDWAGFARGYNGANFAKNKYDEKLAVAFARHSAGAAPDMRTRACQLYLTYCGFDPKGVDGVAGNGTRAAVVAFQTQRGLPPTGALDDATVAALKTAAGV